MHPAYLRVTVVVAEDPAVVSPVLRVAVGAVLAHPHSVPKATATHHPVRGGARGGPGAACHHGEHDRRNPYSTRAHPSSAFDRRHIDPASPLVVGFLHPRVVWRQEAMEVQ